MTEGEGELGERNSEGGERWIVFLSEYCVRKRGRWFQDSVRESELEILVRVRRLWMKVHHVHDEHYEDLKVQE